jgi:hypothetical protein
MMMKNKILNYIVLPLLVFTSCNTDEFLDQPLKGRQQLDGFFDSVENAEKVVNGAYFYISGNSWNELNFMRLVNEMATDDQWAGNTLQPNPDITGIAAYNVFAGSSYFNLFWRSNYRGITRANIGIENISLMENIDENLKSRFLAELGFIRGWSYFELVKNFGGVPLVKSYSELLEPDFVNTTRASIEETYAFIEQDLLAAIPNLPLKSEYADKDRGRVTKGAAQSLLAKMYLYTEQWDKAQSMAKLVIDSGEYQLEPKFEDVWSVGNRSGIESIFEVEFIHDLNFNNIGGGLSVISGSRGEDFWGWGMPTSFLENAFIAEGDFIRLRSTINKHGEPVYGDPDAPEFDGKPSENKSGRVNRKFYIPIALRPENMAAGNTPLSTIHIRYADLLLIHAEAAYFNGQEGVAKESLKEVRDRVELPTNMSLSGAALRDAIWKERHLELALEGHRLYDIRRQKVNGVPIIASILGPNGTFVQYNLTSSDPFETTNNSVEFQTKGDLFDVSKHLLWPIPPEEIQLSQGKITQNPGY